MQSWEWTAAGDICLPKETLHKLPVAPSTKHFWPRTKWHENKCPIMDMRFHAVWYLVPPEALPCPLDFMREGRFQVSLCLRGLFGQAPIGTYVKRVGALCQEDVEIAYMFLNRELMMSGKRGNGWYVSRITRHVPNITLVFLGQCSL